MINVNKQRLGFTIVELLIVIVVLAILATISTVAYNGIQNRARDTSVKQAAFQIKSKIEIWYTYKGSYPTTSQIVEQRLSDDEIPEALLSGGLASILKANAPPDTHSGSYQVSVLACGDATDPTGINVQYYQADSSLDNNYIAGTGCQLD